MSRFRDKLERKKAQGKPSPNLEPATAEPQSELLSQLREKMNQISSRLTPKEKIIHSKRDGDVPGEEVETEVGTVLVVEKRYSLSYRHGRFLAANFLEVGEGLSTLSQDKKLASFDPRGALFLDTETTGLAGGTGTLPFLIGIGWFENDKEFVVRQFFCREPSEEPGQLTLLCEHLEKATSLVTFNGKAFDMPLVNTRFILNRMKNPGAALPHLDLLHIARRVFKRRLKKCNLGNLEAAVLGFERVGDIPGSEIPTAYRQYLRGGPIEPMEAVLEHNALDLVGLAALGAVLEEMYLDPTKVEHAADHLGLAKSALNFGDRATAQSHLTRAGTSTSTDDSRDALILSAKDATKRGEHSESLSLWQKALTTSPHDSYIHLALAKHYEHKEKDFDAALKHAPHTSDAETEEGSAHRVARLNRKRNAKS